jgi:hypothetical protein
MHLNRHTPQQVQRESSQPNQDPSTIAAERRSPWGTSEQPGSANGQVMPHGIWSHWRGSRDRVSAEIPAPPRVVIEAHRRGSVRTSPQRDDRIPEERSRDRVRTRRSLRRPHATPRRRAANCRRASRSYKDARCERTPAAISVANSGNGPSSALTRSVSSRRRISPAAWPARTIASTAST